MDQTEKWIDAFDMVRVKDKKDIPISFWQQNIDKLLAFNDKPVLKGKGAISNLQMEQQVHKIYTQFDQNRKAQEAKEADRIDLETLENTIKKKKNHYFCISRNGQMIFI